MHKEAAYNVETRGQGGYGQSMSNQGKACRQGQSMPIRAKHANEAKRASKDRPVRLHFDVLAKHVEAHCLACLNVILQCCICWCSVYAIWPVALHIEAYLIIISCSLCLGVDAEYQDALVRHAG